ncbi:unnamed protein product [Bursaphelenchus xylophilus]|uniref:(pine wood nematode) hypothetical protein n=1 Tax=Bursaphelenchus xylophilus TaxID=6326 RepID=A0A1I7SJR3_BURXY|nr:unnamed protein product [Bursaphelenchus xylophilus]CAD5212016.1 unnamed protein product [Bursaphelenchus xylophilus]CAG9089219.1 unnamed protein product [Bursaphelenchus xylophilus]CAG9089629.1 unnamed protein product [Bursaphelenchus xylophilus]
MGSVQRLPQLRSRLLAPALSGSGPEPEILGSAPAPEPKVGARLSSVAKRPVAQFAMDEAGQPEEQEWRVPLLRVWKSKTWPADHRNSLTSGRLVLRSGLDPCLR